VNAQEVSKVVSELLEELNELAAGGPLDSLIEEALKAAETTPEESGRRGGPTPSRRRQSGKVVNDAASFDQALSTIDFDSELNKMMEEAEASVNEWALQIRATQSRPYTIRTWGARLSTRRPEPEPAIPAEVYDYFLYLTLKLAQIVDYLLDVGPTDTIRALDIDRFIDDFIKMATALKELRRGEPVAGAGAGPGS